MVDRSKEEDRSLLQVVLNESLSIAPKLNSTQLDILSCCFNFAYTRRLNISNLQMFADYLNDAVLIFSDAIGEKNSNYGHLEYVGCASIRTGSRDVINILMQTYKAVFSKGFERDMVNDIADIDPNIWKVIIPNPHNINLFQASGMDDETIKTACSQNDISEESTNKLIQINNQNMMNKQEATNYLKSICPKFEKFIEHASKSAFNSLELTSVGIAIAHAHSRKKAGFDADLSIWI